MPKYLMIVTSNAQPGQDDEYNDWYDSTHLPDLLAVPGVKAGRRYTADPRSPAPTEGKYLAIYELETDDPTQVFAELGKRAQSGQMVVSSALDAEGAKMWLYEPR